MIIDKNGNGDFRTIQDGINSIAENNTEKITIFIKNGVYKQKLNINKPHVTLIGESAEKTILTFDDHAKKQLTNGENIGTGKSYSTIINGDNFSAENITFENSSGCGSINGPALALNVNADRIKFKNCRFLGRQDTLYTGSLPPQEGPKIKFIRQYYENCYIEGDVDFIFGAGQAVFNKCEIFSINRNSKVNGYITAASTPKEDSFGYVFIECSLTSDAEAGTVYLGRPWRDYAAVAFINCQMGEHIIQEGWHNWGRGETEKTSRYVEYGSSGLGAKTDRRVKWSTILKEEEAKQYAIENVLAGNDNWNPVSE